MKNFITKRNSVRDDNRLSIKNKKLAEEWDYEKNMLSPNDVAINGTQLVWWKCKDCFYEWQARIVDRNRYRPTGINGKTRITVKGSSQCPKCHSFYKRCPELLDEWDYAKNEFSSFVMGTTKKAYWKCKICNYSWVSEIASRIKGYGNCPQCNSILLKFPYVAEEYSKENEKPVNLSNYGSGRKAKWKCKTCGNKWEATIASRTSGGSGCPKCSKIKLKDGTLCDSKT